MFALSDGPIDRAVVEAAVRHPSCGAVLVFGGAARQDVGGRTVLRLAYEAYPQMAVTELQAIGAEILERWPGSRVAIVHRIGEVPIGEDTVVIAVAAPHRAECYAASRYALEALKSRVPIWKKEVYVDGEAWKANERLGD